MVVQDSSCFCVCACACVCFYSGANVQLRRLPCYFVGVSCQVLSRGRFATRKVVSFASGHVGASATRGTLNDCANEPCGASGMRALRH